MRADRHSPGKEWTVEEKAKAAALWNDGVSAGKIAARFGVERNSIIGLVHRNRTLFTRQGGKPKAETKLSGKAAHVIIVDEVKLAPSKSEPKPTYVKPSALGASIGMQMRSGAKPTRRYDHAGDDLASVAFFDLGRRQCRWPVNGFDDRSGAAMPCCGAEIVPGRSYCQAHLKLAYKVMRP